MNKDDIEQLWKIASNDPNHDSNWFDPVIIKFAELVEAKEREACAEMRKYFWCPDIKCEAAVNNALDFYAGAIRARGPQ